MTEIYDVASGDFVLAPTGEWEKIRYVESIVDRVNPLHYREWYVITTAGSRLSMFDARLYRTAAEMATERDRGAVGSATDF